jgi:hypothetical protein
MARMGHDNERAALIYQHASNKADRKIAEGLDALLGEHRSNAGDQGDNDGEDRRTGAGDLMAPLMAR